MINNISTNQMQNPLRKPHFQQQEPVNPQPVNNNEVSTQVSFDSLIDKVLDAAPADNDAVQKARELLLSGRLDKPENIRAAAEDIAKFGV